MRPTLGSLAVVTSAEKVLPDPTTPFGERVARRLRQESVIWFTTVATDGTPQPNPVWFLWEGADTILIYNLRTAHRLDHIRRRPEVSLNFDGDGSGGDVIVLTGHAEVASDVPGPDELPAYVEKYGDPMIQVSGGREAFAQRYSVPVRVTLRRIRGF